MPKSKTPPPGRATITDVAQMAAVGASTVSRYLRGVPVKPAVAARVAKAVEALGYSPDAMARSLRIGRTNTIGLLLPKVSNVFFSQAVQLMETEVRHRGCTLIVLTHDDMLSKQTANLETLRRYRADGLSLTAAAGTELAHIRSTLGNTPVVAFDAEIASAAATPACSSVVLRNREAAHAATEHLLRHGYKRIACVTAKPDIYSFRERAAGYTDAMLARKLKPVLVASSDYERLRYSIGTLLRSRQPPHALLSLSDFATLNIFSTFEELGLTSDQRTPLIGFDDFSFAPFLEPPLTVIRQPIEKMVRYALHLLFQAIEAQASKAPAPDFETISLPGELIRRRSCGCP